MFIVRPKINAFIDYVIVMGYELQSCCYSFIVILAIFSVIIMSCTVTAVVL